MNARLLYYYDFYCFIAFRLPSLSARTMTSNIVILWIRLPFMALALLRHYTSCEDFARLEQFDAFSGELFPFYVTLGIVNHASLKAELKVKN